jgi:hypothetical protein
LIDYEGFSDLRGDGCGERNEVGSRRKDYSLAIVPWLDHTLLPVVTESRVIDHNGLRPSPHIEPKLAVQHPLQDIDLRIAHFA